MYEAPDGTITLLPPPEGYEVNYADPARQANIETYYVTAFGNALAFLFILQKLYVNIGLEKKLQIDGGTCFSYDCGCARLNLANLRM